MQQLITLAKKPRTAVTADRSRRISLSPIPSQDMLIRLQGVLEFLGLGDHIIKPVYNNALDKGKPRAFFPHPYALLVRMGKKPCAAEYSTLCLKLLNRYGTIGYWLERKLIEGRVQPDPSNLKGWSERIPKVKPPINRYEQKWSPEPVSLAQEPLQVYELELTFIRFLTDTEVFNLAAFEARKPLLRAGLIPGGLYEWALASAVFPKLKNQLVEHLASVLHPGSRVSDGALMSIAATTYAWEWCGRVECEASWDGDVYPADVLFGLR